MSRDAIMVELLEIEGMLQDDRLNDNDRHALYGAQQALRNVLASEMWQQASQTFYRIDNRPSEAVSLLLHQPSGNIKKSNAASQPPRLPTGWAMHSRGAKFPNVTPWNPMIPLALSHYETTAAHHL